MTDAFFDYFRDIWLSRLPGQLMRAILVAALFELLVYLVNARLRRALAGVLARDAAADGAQRLVRRRVVLGIPSMLVRTVLYAAAILVILRIFRHHNEADLYPIGVALLVLLGVGTGRVLRDVVSGYFIHYDYLYCVGDEVTVGAHSGMVSEIGLRYTRLRTRDGQDILIPNGQVRDMVNRTGPRRRGEQ